MPTSTLLLYVSFPLRVATLFWGRDVRRCGREWEWSVRVAEGVRGSGMAGGLAEWFVSGWMPAPMGPGGWRVNGGGGGGGAGGGFGGGAPTRQRD